MYVSAGLSRLFHLRWWGAGCADCSNHAESTTYEGYTGQRPVPAGCADHADAEDHANQTGGVGHVDSSFRSGGIGSSDCGGPITHVGNSICNN